MTHVLVGPTIEENLSIGYLSSALRVAGFGVEQVSFTEDHEHLLVAKSILEYQPRLVGLSLTSQTRAAGFLRLATSLRELGYRGHLTAGGHFASLAASNLLTEFGELDSILQGEAERSVVELARRLRDNNSLRDIPGIVLPHKTQPYVGPKPTKECDLDRIHPPFRQSKRRTEMGFPLAEVISSRGCGGGCRYCSIHAFGCLSTGPSRRERSPDNIAAEIAQLWHNYKTRIFVFHDDDFFSGDHKHDAERAQALGQALGKERLPRLAITLKARPDDVNYDLFAFLREIGLVQVVLGIDNHSPQVLRRLGRRTSPLKNLAALKTLRQLDLAVASNLLLWEPDTTLDNVRENLPLLRAWPQQIFNLARAEAYEGAVITRRLAQQGRLLGSILGWDYQLGDAQAEESFRVFVKTLGNRCYSQSGVHPQATRLDRRVRILQRLAASKIADQLRQQADVLVGHIATSTRKHMESIVANVDHAIAGDSSLNPYVNSLADTIAAEDHRFNKQVEHLLNLCAGLNKSTQQTSSFLAPAFIRNNVRRITLGLATVSTLTACASSLQRPDSQQPKAPPPRLDNTRTNRPQQIPIHHNIKLTLTPKDYAPPASCGGCSHPGPTPLISYRVDAIAPPPMRFVRIQTSHGTTQLVAVSPNGRRASAVLYVDTPSHIAPTNDQPISQPTVQVLYQGKHRIVSAQATFDLAASSFVPDCIPGPCSDPAGPPPGGWGLDCSPLPHFDKSLQLRLENSVVFTKIGQADIVNRHAWPHQLVFGVGLISPETQTESQPNTRVPVQERPRPLNCNPITTNPQQAPQVECSTGRIIRLEALPLAVGIRRWTQVTYTPVGANSRMKAGAHSCRVRYELPEGTTHEAEFPFIITENGDLETPFDGPI